MFSKVTSPSSFPKERVKCIVHPKDESTPPIKGNKYLLPSDLTASQLVKTIRNRVEIRPQQALYVFCGNRLVCGNETVKDMADRQGGILKVRYALENTFGTPPSTKEI